MGFFGFRKSTGKHAAPKGRVPVPRPPADESGHRPAHAATMQRATGPDTEQEATDSEAASDGAERKAA